MRDERPGSTRGPIGAAFRMRAAVFGAKPGGIWPCPGDCRDGGIVPGRGAP